MKTALVTKSHKCDIKRTARENPTRDEAGGMRTALVTGSAGFIGRHLVPKLEAAGYAITGIDPLWPFPASPCTDPGCKSAHGDGTIHGFTFEDWLRTGYGYCRFDVVVHLAAHIPDISERMKGGLYQFQDIALDWAVANYVKEHPPRECFLVPSSCAVDTPEDPYAWVKLTAERFWMELHKAGVPVVILRPFSGYGPDQAPSYPFRAILDRALRRDDPLTVWGNGAQERDFIHVGDLTDAFIWAIDKAPRGVPVQIGTGIGTDFRTLAHMIAEAVGYSTSIAMDMSKPASSARRVADTTLAESFGFKAKISLKTGIEWAIAMLFKEKADRDVAAREERQSKEFPEEGH